MRRVLRQLGRELSGAKRTKLTNVFKANLTAEIFREETKAFLAKSTGGTDEFGNRWKPLAPSTVAAS